MKRYVYSTGGMYEFSNGKYVEYAEVEVLQAENERLNAEATADADLIKRLNASLAEAQAERDRLREALSECEVVLDGLTAHSYDSGSNFDFRVKNAHRIARKALEGEGK